MTSPNAGAVHIAQPRGFDREFALAVPGSRSTGFPAASRLASVVTLIAGTLVAGCSYMPWASSGPTALAAPDVPATLKPPSSQKVFVEAFATGFQIYECSAKPNQPDALQWTFKAPEAKLADRSGQPLGKHYGGPTWESVDGSLIRGEVRASDPGPTPSAIPWLLLGVKEAKGQGVLTPTSMVQRVKTVGGVAPTSACTPGQVARVPYTATYYFYKPAA